MSANYFSCYCHASTNLPTFTQYYTLEGSNKVTAGFLLKPRLCLGPKEGRNAETVDILCEKNKKNAVYFKELKSIFVIKIIVFIYSALLLESSLVFKLFDCARWCL